MSIWEDLKTAIEQIQHDLPQIEERIRNSLFWDTGDSRVFLWLSALATFTVLITVIGNVVGRLVEWCFVRLNTKPQPTRVRSTENETARRAGRAFRRETRRLWLYLVVAITMSVGGVWWLYRL